MNSIEHIDKIETWLHKMGLESTERHRGDPSVLIAHAWTSSREDYTIHFIPEKRDVLFESYVFKSVSGENKKIKWLYEAMLAYNSSVIPLAFGLVEVSSGEWRIALRATQEYGLLNPEYLKRVMDAYDIAYEEHLPRFKSLAEELGLTFDGRSSEYLSDLIRSIIGKNDY